MGSVSDSVEGFLDTGAVDSSSESVECFLNALGLIGVATFLVVLALIGAVNGGLVVVMIQMDPSACSWVTLVQVVTIVGLSFTIATFF